MAKNKKWSASAKFKIVVEAIKGEVTLNELCNRYEVSPSQVSAWKKKFLEDGQELFNKNSDKSTNKALAESARKQKELYQTIGQLTVERDFLKKSWKKFQGNDDESS